MDKGNIFLRFHIIKAFGSLLNSVWIRYHESQTLAGKYIKTLYWTILCVNEHPNNTVTLKNLLGFQYKASIATTSKIYGIYSMSVQDFTKSTSTGRKIISK